jgi:hypothetical protein
MITTESFGYCIIQGSFYSRSNDVAPRPRTSFALVIQFYKFFGSHRVKADNNVCDASPLERCARAVFATLTFMRKGTERQLLVGVGPLLQRSWER